MAADIVVVAANWGLAVETLEATAPLLTDGLTICAKSLNELSEEVSAETSETTCEGSPEETNAWKPLVGEESRVLSDELVSPGGVTTTEYANVKLSDPILSVSPMHRVSW